MAERVTESARNCANIKQRVKSNILVQPLLRFFILQPMKLRCIFSLRKKDTMVERNKYGADSFYQLVLIQV